MDASRVSRPCGLGLRNQVKRKRKHRAHRMPNGPAGSSPTGVAPQWVPPTNGVWPFASPPIRRSFWIESAILQNKRHKRKDSFKRHLNRLPELPVSIGDWTWRQSGRSSVP